MIKKDETTASTAKIAIWYVFANFLAKGMAMITTPIFTRLLSKSEYGQFSTFISWENVITILVTLDLSASIARAKYDYDERMGEYISSILACSNLVTLIFYFIVELNHPFFERLFSVDMIYIRMLFVYLLFMPAFSYLQIKHRIYKKYRFFVVFAIGSAVVRTVVSVVLVLLMDDRLMGRMYGYMIPITIFNFLLWMAVFIDGKKVSWDCIKYACKISIPLIPHALSTVVLGSVDRIMITKICGSSETALYSVAYSIGMAASLLWSSMNQAWTPWLYDNINAGNYKEIRKKSKIYLGVFSVLVFAVLLVTPEIMLFMGGLQYYSARYVMPPVILGFVFQFIYGMYVNVEIYAKKTFTISLGTMAAAILNYVLNGIFIPKYGYIVAAFTTMVGYVALFVFHYFIVKFRMPEYSDLYDKKFIFLILGLMMILGMGIYVLYEYNIIRYALIVVYIIALCVGIYKYRDSIKKIFKR